MYYVVEIGTLFIYIRAQQASSFPPFHLVLSLSFYLTIIDKLEEDLLLPWLASS